MLLLLLFVLVIVQGQLSINELFFFNSKYTFTDNCSNFQYTFTDLRLNYKQLIFDCDSSRIIFRNQDQISSSVCPNDEESIRNLLIHFYPSSQILFSKQTLIQVNQLRLPGIELSSLDDLIRSVYLEYSYYRSQRALLMKFEKHHLAFATNGEMTFILFLLSSEYNTITTEKKIEVSFPNDNSFIFNRSLINVWRIDKGFVRIPKPLENINIYQLSKSKFTLFNNETFLLYGTQMANKRRFLVTIDETRVICTYDDILQCTFPILPLNTRDTHEPVLRVIYNYRNIFNASLTLIPRTRLDRIPMNHRLDDIGTFKVNIDENLCGSDSLKSLFNFIIHLSIEDINGTVHYQKLLNNYIEPVDCNTTAEIGKEIEKVMISISISDIITMNLDLIHQWADHLTCQAERTRVSFI